MALTDTMPAHETASDDVLVAAPRDYISLMKPRVMSLVVFTALVGLVLAPGGLHPVLAVVALLCVAVGAGASGALNMWYEADIDALMTRTARRPLPAGRVDRQEALAFGVLLAAGSVLVLGLAANWLAAFLLAFTIFFYVGVYTMGLKRRTPQNIVIGGAAGAFPPMIGWAAASGEVGLEAVVLFLVIFVWTPPHFWALALVKADDYARAGVPMMPNVAGRASTARQILAYSLLMAPLGVAPALVGLAGPLYAVVSVVAGAAFLALAVRLYRARGGADLEPARHLFAFSVLYLFVLFAVLLIERGLDLAPFAPVLVV